VNRTHKVKVRKGRKEMKGERKRERKKKDKVRGG